VAADLIELAHSALDSVQSSPGRALELAERAGDEARAARDAEARSTAIRAAGLALKEVGRIDDAVQALEQARAVALRARLEGPAALAAMSLAVVLFDSGRSARALRYCRLAEPHLSGLDAARLATQRGLILGRLGRTEEALACFARAAPVLDRHGDAVWSARLHNNRGLVLAYRGALARAQDDLERALALYRQLGATLFAAQTRHNIGFVAGRRGDVPGALALFDAAVADYVACDVHRSVLLADHCEVLLAAGLVGEARDAAAAAVAELEQRGIVADLAEARLMLAHAALRDDDPGEAVELAAGAAAAFAAQGRAPWTALARHAGLEARWAAGERSADLRRRATDAARDLAAAGWAIAALDARLIAARMLLETGGEHATVPLPAVAQARRHGSVELRARAWHLEALQRHARGDRRGAALATLAGLSAVARFQANLGSAELRAHSSSHASDLAAFGLRLALEQPRPERVLAWAERLRAGALQTGSTRPPADPQLASLHEELRSVAAAADEATYAGADAARLRRRQAAVERRIAALARRQPGTGRLAALPPRDLLRRLADELADRVLVELVEAGGVVHAVTVSRSGRRLHRLCALAEAVRELDLLGFSLRQLADRSDQERSRILHGGNVEHSAERLDDLLLRPLAGAIGDRDLIISPTGELHALPWALLPSGRGRAITVTPSAALWLDAGALPEGAWAGSDRVVLVAGPGLPEAEAEIEALAARYPRALRLSGPDAVASRVLHALAGADCAHVAAHGSFRAENPFFSHLRLADGRITVYELEGLGHAPRSLILSACESALSDVKPGERLMGLAATLFSLGTRTLLGSVARVRDETARRLMVSLHRDLAAGAAPAAALARASARTIAETGDVGAAAFVCFGRG
jgi:tetratricopeptide (TPR) repeat protein